MLNLEEEHRRKTAVQTVAAVFLPIAAISVILRCYVRGWIVKAFGWDDAAMVLAMVCSCSCSCSLLFFFFFLLSISAQDAVWESQ
jgi:hypothetical protein